MQPHGGSRGAGRSAGHTSQLEQSRLHPSSRPYHEGSSLRCAGSARRVRSGLGCRRGRFLRAHCCPRREGGSAALGLVAVVVAVFPWSPRSRVQGPLNLLVSRNLPEWGWRPFPQLCLLSHWNLFPFKPQPAGPFLPWAAKEAVFPPEAELAVPAWLLGCKLCPCPGPVAHPPASP